MKRWLVAGLIAVASAGVLIVGSGFALQSIVKGSGKGRVLAALQDKMGVPVTVASVDFDLLRWLTLRPTLALHTVTIGNPAGFQSEHVLEAKRILARVHLMPLLHKIVEVESIRVDEPRIVVEKNAQGQSNVQLLIKKLTAKPDGTATPIKALASGVVEPAPTNGNSSLSIGELSITDGTLVLAGAEGLNLHSIDIRIRDLGKGSASKIDASAKMFSGKISALKLSGQAGPFSSDSLPLDATVSTTIAPSEVPSSMRSELLSAPGDKARVTIEGGAKGDLYTTFSGPAKIVLTNIMIGNHPSHLLPLSGEAPSTITGTNLMSNPDFEVNIPNLKLQLGNGQWTGGADVHFRGIERTGETHGDIRNIDITQFLACFSKASDKLSGMMAISPFTLRFSGKSSEEMRASLNGKGKIAVSQGRLGVLDLPATLERVLGKPKETSEGTKGETAFNSLSSDLIVAHSKLEAENLVLDGPRLSVTGNGTVGFDQSLSFKLVAHVSGTLARLANTASLRLPAGNADIPVEVTGTLEAPKVHPEIGTLAKQHADSVLKVLRKRIP